MLPTSPTGKLVVLVVADVDGRHHRHPHRTRVGEPILGPDEGGAHVLGAHVVLPHDRTEPLDDLTLHLHRTRRRRMADEPQRGHVIALPHLGRQLEEADEHGRHELSGGDAVPLDGLETGRRVPLLEDHRGGPHAMGHRGEDHRSRVVQRRRREVDVATVVGDRARVLDERVDVVHGAVGEREQDPLRPPRGARRVEHPVPLRLFGQRGGRLLTDDVLVALPAVQVAVDHQRDLGLDVGDAIGQVDRRDDRACPAVTDDVGDLGRRQVPVHGRVVQPRPQGGPHHLEVAQVVGEQDGDVVAAAKTPLVPELRQLVGALVELLVRERGARAGHDHGRMVGTLAGEGARRRHRR